MGNTKAKYRKRFEPENNGRDRRWKEIVIDQNEGRLVGESGRRTQNERTIARNESSSNPENERKEDK